MTPSARESFLANLAYLEAAVDAPTVLNPSSSDPTARNAARFTRNGLAVLGFVVFEDFVRERSVELATYLSNGVAHFDKMPNALRRAATITTVLNLARRVARFADDEVARDALVRQTGIELSTLSGSGFSISHLALSWSGSNLTAEALEALLTALHVEKPWPSVTHTLTRLGFAEIKDARRAFEAMQGQRHRAAHDASTDIDIVGLAALPRSALALGMSFDILATNAAGRLHAGDTAFLTGSGLKASAVRYRYLSDRGHHHAEFVGETAKRAAFRHADFHAGFAAALQRAKGADETLIVQNRSSAAIDWRVP